MNKTAAHLVDGAFPAVGVRYHCPMADSHISPEQRKEFDAALRRTLKQRLDYSFIHTHNPVLDDAPWRSFDTMEEYRRWCRENLPSWLGYA